MKKYLWFLALPLLSACAISKVYIVDPSQNYEPVTPTQVKVFSTEPPTSNYTVIGSIAVNNVGDGMTALKLLKEKAAAIGANAVIEARVTKLNSYSSRTGLSGTAIRF